MSLHNFTLTPSSHLDMVVVEQREKQKKTKSPTATTAEAATSAAEEISISPLSPSHQAFRRAPGRPKNGTRDAKGSKAKVVYL